MDTLLILKGIGFVLLGIGLFLLVTYAVMRLWNWLIPNLFKGPRLRFVQALGLFFLARLLFGFGGPWHGGFGRNGHHGYGPRGDGRPHRWNEPPRPNPKSEKRSTNYPIQTGTNDQSLIQE